jgi:hypothetical protein
VHVCNEYLFTFLAPNKAFATIVQRLHYVLTFFIVPNFDSDARLQRVLTSKHQAKRFQHG